MKKTITLFLSGILTLSVMAQQPNRKHITQTAGRDALAEFAPEFARANDDILFGEV